MFEETIVVDQIYGGIVQGSAKFLVSKGSMTATVSIRQAASWTNPIPRANEMPPLVVDHHLVPYTNNPLGAKGAGESGVAGALPSAYSAVLDALGMCDVNNFDFPATPARIWSALQPMS